MARRAYRPPPSRPRQKRPKGKKTPKSARSFGGFLALVGAAAAACAAVLLNGARARKEQDRRDSRLLERARRVPFITTEHAACRKDCRHISSEEVDEVLQKGRINNRKSDLDMMPCRKLVVGGTVGPDKKNVECVLSACPQNTTLITVIDLDRSWSNCYCP
mmetsp:Transcript_13850/g.41820  ORF Transcript_13850/g.41820 Transcript_13850/m.41820 type:complete len:161 (+) Transcript_13850:419-901(+)